MGHAEQYARMRARIAQQTQHLHNPHSFGDMYARTRIGWKTHNLHSFSDM